MEARETRMKPKCRFNIILVVTLAVLTAKQLSSFKTLEFLTLFSASSVATTCSNQSTPMPGSIVVELNQDRLPFLQHVTKNSSEMCQLLVSTPVASLWADNLDTILSASRPDRDPKFVTRNFTSHVLHLTSPRLASAIRTLPRERDLVKRLMEKADARYQYLQHQNLHGTNSGDASSPPPAPLKILVLGGSVTMGINCYTDIRWVRMLHCAWSTRLANFLNNFAGGTLVEVTNLAVGGTNTKTGEAILEYELMPESAKNPDVIINAFSTNDMHILTMNEAKSQNVTLRGKIFDMAQSFVRTAMRPQHHCSTTENTDEPHHESHTPLLLWLDDYLGNEQREILSTTELSQSISVLASYYGFGFLSYADMVRDWVYANTRETTFSPNNWYDLKSNTGGMKREIHHGQGMHTIMPWIISFYFLHLASLYCSFENWDTLSTSSLGPASVPQTPSALPPKLTHDLRLDTVSADWNVSSSEGQPEEMAPCSSTSGSKCLFSWLSGLGDDSFVWEADVKRRNFLPYLVPPVASAWDLIDETKQNKFGWQPINATSEPFTLEFRNITQSVGSVTLFTLKSYGPNWEDSGARVVVESGSAGQEDMTWDIISNQTLTGYHNKTTSEMYVETLPLARSLNAGMSLRIAVRLVTGRTFKILGIAVCK